MIDIFLQKVNTPDLVLTRESAIVIEGIGIDVVDIDRFSQSLLRTPALADRLFTSREKSLPPSSLAARFAAKEALAKALNAGKGLPWLDAEVINTESGKPVFLCALPCVLARTLSLSLLF